MHAGLFRMSDMSSPEEMKCVFLCVWRGVGVLYKAENAILTHVDLTLKGFLQQIV